MSHLKPFNPAMACERQPLSKLPLEARDMIKAYCGPPTPTPTATIVNTLRKNLYFRKYSSTYLTLALGKDLGFHKYLRNNFDHSPGSVWTSRYTHRKLGHVLFCNGIGLWGGCRAAIDSNGNSIKYPGWV